MKVLEKKINRLVNDGPIQMLKETVGEVKSSINSAISILNDLLNFDKVSNLMSFYVFSLIFPLTYCTINFLP